MRLMNFDRHLSLDKIRSLGFTKELSVEESWYPGFDRVRDAKLML